MLGLLIKDLINLKKSIMLFGIITIAYAIFSIISEDLSFFTSISIMLFAMLTLSVFSTDEMAKWDSFVLTMPISRDKVVQSKYVMLLLISFAGLLYSAGFSLVINLYIKSDSISDNIMSSLIGTAIVLLLFSIMIPFIIKMGVEKARLILVLIYMVPFAVAYLYKTVIVEGNVVIPENISKVMKLCVSYGYLLLPAIVLLALAISYNVTLQIYRKKEF